MCFCMCVFECVCVLVPFGGLRHFILENFHLRWFTTLIVFAKLYIQILICRISHFTLFLFIFLFFWVHICYRKVRFVCVCQIVCTVLCVIIWCTGYITLIGVLFDISMIVCKKTFASCWLDSKHLNLSHLKLAKG